MIKKELSVYICSEKVELINGLKFDACIAGHNIGQKEERKVIYPTKIDTETINPKSFIKLKEKLKIDEMLFVDEIKGADKIISITDHVNRSGQNFLRSKTPEGELPQFPDMSKIYNPIKDFDSGIVHTIGAERFKNQQIGNNTIFSAFVGLISPVAHYVGIKIFALGSEDIDKIINQL